MSSLAVAFEPSKAKRFPPFFALPRRKVLCLTCMIYLCFEFEREREREGEREILFSKERGRERDFVKTFFYIIVSPFFTYSVV